ncbi:MAG: 7-carboxy-7-deazaguanine synthase QueE, partial [Synechococcaceae bacterium WB4_1_0192]|nr:7-carboxy-7-deazaguanine synthase QueE [Synechococcaceae bacterium WB4_1_0192]
MNPTAAASSATLPVVESFHSLQGEGLHSGRSALFIRLGGCSVGCSWCDTKHSWPAAVHPQRSLDDLAAEARKAATDGAAFVVITGGEPLEHDLAPLTEALAAAGLPLHLACYDLLHADVTESEPWLAVRHTDWSSRVRPLFRHTRR